MALLHCNHCVQSRYCMPPKPQAARLAREQMSRAQAATRQGDSDGEQPIERPRE